MMTRIQHAAAGLVCMMMLGGPASSALAQARSDRPPFPMLAHWTFDAVEGDDTLVQDVGPYQLHGQLRSEGGDAVTRVPGVRGEALQFPRRHLSWVALDDVPQWQVSPPFTIAVWVKPQRSSRSQMEIFNHKYDHWRRGYRFAVSSNRIRFEYSDGQDNIHVQIVAPPVSPEHWSFVACVHTGRMIRLFVDGEMVHEERANPRWVRTPGPAAIGNFLGAKQHYGYEGLMDELMFVRRALSSEQLVQLGMWSRRPIEDAPR